ncbi:hypothetical protein [Bacillus sp. B-jedd]|uniref:hypothetical protein n=1 Tax=Bacillus sp. B-jedd TaxID=1476857 RepID=UPI0005156539|nr:hypothetical protein [Bacillus sp. B-jedd]CEG26399.1 hypothetical protein BN1002_01244 [Bacillus sp. B-jedd]
MNITTDSLVVLCITLGIPTFMGIREYLKMDQDDKKTVMKDFRSPDFIFTIGFFVLGALLTQLGDLFTFSTIKGIGFVLIMISSIVSTFHTWKKSRFKSLIIFILISFLIFLNVKYLIPRT